MLVQMEKSAENRSSSAVEKKRSSTKNEWKIICAQPTGTTTSFDIETIYSGAQINQVTRPTTLKLPFFY